MYFGVRGKRIRQASFWNRGREQDLKRRREDQGGRIRHQTARAPKNHVYQYRLLFSAYPACPARSRTHASAPRRGRGRVLSHGSEVGSGAREEPLRTCTQPPRHNYPDKSSQSLEPEARQQCRCGFRFLRARPLTLSTATAEASAGERYRGRGKTMISKRRRTHLSQSSPAREGEEKIFVGA